MPGVKGQLSGSPKAPGDRIRRNKRADAGELVALEGARGKRVPAYNEKWRESTIDEWHAFWTSPVAQLSSPDSDMGALRRLFDYKDELAHAIEVVRQEREMYSDGGNRLSPAFKEMQNLEKIVLALEDRFGMTPNGRLRLGATLGDASKGLAEMNAAIDQEVSPGDHDDDTDPRDFLDAKVAN